MPLSGRARLGLPGVFVSSSGFAFDYSQGEGCVKEKAQYLVASAPHDDNMLVFNHLGADAGRALALVHPLMYVPVGAYSVSPVGR